jgi:GNAT superfamily N-acetyltransferase
MSEAVVRTATVADLPGCAAVANAWIDATPWLPRVHTAEAIAAMFEPGLLERRTLLVAEEDGDVVGYLSLGENGFVAALYLAAGARGHGVGKALMDRAKALHPEGLELTVFEPNDGARRFYAREGFVPVPDGRETDTEEGVPTLRLRWKGRPA